MARNYEKLSPEISERIKQDIENGSDANLSPRINMRSEVPPPQREK